MWIPGPFETVFVLPECHQVGRPERRMVWPGNSPPVSLLGLGHLAERGPIIPRDASGAAGGSRWRWAPVWDPSATRQPPGGEPVSPAPPASDRRAAGPGR